MPTAPCSPCHISSRRRSSVAALPRHLLLRPGFDRRVFLLLADDRSDGLQAVFFFQVDELDALRVAPRFADVANKSAYHLATRGDEHDFIVVADGERADDRSGLLGGFHR